MGNKPTTFHLSAQDHFRCLAGNCPATCCSGWQIEVEPELVERWKSLPDPRDRERFPQLVQAGHTAQPGKLYMTSGHQPRCGLLNNDNLCDAHSRYGVEYTPLSCRSFPRMQEVAGSIRIESASAACPVIADQLVNGLLNQELFSRTAPDGSDPRHEAQNGTQLALTHLVGRVMAEHTEPLGVRLFWLAENACKWRIDPVSLDVHQRDLNDNSRHVSQSLHTLSIKVRDGSLRADPVIAGSFWNTIYQLGYSRHLYPAESRPGSPLRSGESEPPADRHAHYSAVYDEILKLRGQPTFSGSRNLGVAADRIAHLHLINAGFPWQPSLSDYRLSFAHAVIFFALTSLRWWLSKSRGVEDQQTLVEAVYRTARAFGHNTMILEQIQANPAFLDLDRYHQTFLDL